MYKICVNCLEKYVGLKLDSEEISVCEICKEIEIVIEVRNNLYDLVWQENIINKY